MSFSNCSASRACAFTLAVMAATPYHRFTSSLGLVSSGMTSLVLLGTLAGLFIRDFSSRRGSAPAGVKGLVVIGCFLAIVAVSPEWIDLVFYARGDSVPLTFAPFWALRILSCVATAGGSSLLAYALADSGYVVRPVAGTSAIEKDAWGPNAKSGFYQLLLLSCLLFCCRSSWRVIPSPWRASLLPVLPIGVAYLLPLLAVVLLPLILFRRFDAPDRNRGDASVGLVLLAMPLGVVPSVIVTYFATDVLIVALLLADLVLMAATLTRLFLRRKDIRGDQETGVPEKLDMGLFSSPLSPRETQFVYLLLEGKTPAEIAMETDTKAATVRTTLHRVYVKAAVGSARELVALIEGSRQTSEAKREARCDFGVQVRSRSIQKSARLTFAVFLSMLALGPLTVATEDWGSGAQWMVMLSLCGYFTGLGHLLAGNAAHPEEFVIVRSISAGIEGMSVWTALSALEWSFAYAVSWRCVRDTFMWIPILFCAAAGTIPLLLGAYRAKASVRPRTFRLVFIVLSSLAAASAARARMPSFMVLTGVLLVFWAVRYCKKDKLLSAWMICFGLSIPCWIVALNSVQDLVVFEPQFLVSVLGGSSAVNIVLATVITCSSALMFVTHVLFVRYIEDEKAVAEYRVGESGEGTLERQFALLKSRALSDVQAKIMLETAMGTTTKEIASDVGYAASTVQALRSASYRQLGVKGKAELVLFLSQVGRL